MIRKLLGLSGPNGSGSVVNTRFTRYMQPIINISLDPGALDSSQAWLLDVVETETEWRVFVNGAGTQPILYLDGKTYDNSDSTFLAIKTKSNDVRTGWNKFLDINGQPKPVLSPSFNGSRFDTNQIWTRTVLVEGGVWKNWCIGEGTGTVYRPGYTTSANQGESWATPSQVYEDTSMTDGHGIVVLRVVHDDTNYKMIYSGIDPDTLGLFIAQSSDGITGWTKTHSNLFENQNYGFPSDFRYISGTYYLWLQRKSMMPENNLGPFRDVHVLTSTNLVDWTDHGVQLTLKNQANEFGIGNHVKCLQKPNGLWFIMHSFYSNRFQAYVPPTKESTIGMKVSESNTSGSFIMNSSCDFSWPEYTTFHAPLDAESGYEEVIEGVPGTLSSGIPNYWERGFIKLTGSQTLTFPNSGVISGAHFSVKMRVEIITSGNRELFKIGNDIIMTIESGKLRVRLSSDGVTYQKDFITTVNISKPVGLDYLDNHIYVGFMWDGTTIRMWNDFVEFTTGQITKTVDNALTTVNNSGDDILIGQNAAIELRSVSVCSEITETEFKELDL